MARVHRWYNLLPSFKKVIFCVRTYSTPGYKFFFCLVVNRAIDLFLLSSAALNNRSHEHTNCNCKGEGNRQVLYSKGGDWYKTVRTCPLSSKASTRSSLKTGPSQNSRTVTMFLWMSDIPAYVVAMWVSFVLFNWCGSCWYSSFIRFITGDMAPSVNLLSRSLWYLDMNPLASSVRLALPSQHWK